MNVRASVFSLLVLLLLCPRNAPAFPEGLYWVVEQFPDAFFPYNASEPRAGAERAIDAACRINPGQGVYTGGLVFQIQFPAHKAALCQVRRPPIPGTIFGNYYHAVLYCNGVKRDEMNDDPCPPSTPPAPAIDPVLNLGAPPACPLP